MATNLQTSPESSVTSLLTGIVNDFQDLIKQQMALFKHEVSSDMRTTREVTTSLAVGLGILFVGAILLCLMLVHLLAWAFPNLPLWACYGIVGGMMAAVGGVLAWQAQQRFETFNPLPDESVAALQENLEWKTKPR